LGPALAPGQPLLLIGTAGSGFGKPQPRIRLGLLLDLAAPGTAVLHLIFTQRACIPVMSETISLPVT
jgi:hypothetical protein